MKKFMVLPLLAALLLAACSNSAGGEGSNGGSSPTNTTTTTPETPTPATTYTIICGTFANGTVTADSSNAAAGTTVTLTINPASNCELSTLGVTEENGTPVTLSGTGNSRTFAMPANNVTVTATFVVLPTAAYTKTGTITFNGTEYDLVTFGLWPQTIKADSVTVNESDMLKRGDFTYCKGSDGQWYVKQAENAYKSGVKYRDGTDVSQGGTSEKWFKVEPIKWRVLTTDYNGTGKKLLFAEDILIARRYDASKNNYQNSEIRKWLNSNAASFAVSDHGDSDGFLKTAFTATQIAAILGVSVDNSTRSTNPDAALWNSEKNQYASDTPTTDKAFLLSVQEATKNCYGFTEYNVGMSYGVANARVCVGTDFAKACGVYEDSRITPGGWWWLRSPGYPDDKCAYRITSAGLAGHCESVTKNCFGIVPALCVSN